MARRVTIELKPEQSRFLDQERSRLLTQHKLRVSNQDIIRTLIEQHRLRVMQAAEEDKAYLWYYERLKEHERDTAAAGATSATRTAEDGSRRGAQGRPPKRW